MGHRRVGGRDAHSGRWLSADFWLAKAKFERYLHPNHSSAFYRDSAITPYEYSSITCSHGHPAIDTAYRAHLYAVAHEYIDSLMSLRGE